jgi:hypothetical protein
MVLLFLEARTGIEPVYVGFADRCVTASPPGQHYFTVQVTHRSKTSDESLHWRLSSTSPPGRVRYSIICLSIKQRIVGARRLELAGLLKAKRCARERT